MNSTPIAIIFILVIVAIIILYSTYFTNKAVIKRKFKKAQHKKISEFKDGDVAKFTGVIESIDEPLSAPLSHRKCAYYSVHIEQKVSSGKSSHWKTLLEKSDSNKFIIRGANGCAFINGGRQKRHIVMDQEFSSGFMDDPLVHLEEYLTANGIASENFIGMNKTIRYREGVLELGEKVAVLGKGEWRTPEELGLPLALGKVLAITDYGDDYLYFTDEVATTQLAEQKVAQKKEPKRVEEKRDVKVADEYKRRNEEMKRKIKETKRKGRYLK